MHLVETKMSSEDEFDSASVVSRRNRKQTTKGKQFHAQLLEDQRSSAQKNLHVDTYGSNTYIVLKLKLIEKKIYGGS